MILIYHQVVVVSLKRLRKKVSKVEGGLGQRADADHFCKLRNFSVRFMRIRLCVNYLSSLSNEWAGLGAH